MNGKDLKIKPSQQLQSEALLRSKCIAASFTSLKPGTTFQYRVSKNGKVVFNSEAKALKSARTILSHCHFR